VLLCGVTSLEGAEFVAKVGDTYLALERGEICGEGNRWSVVTRRDERAGAVHVW